MIYKFTLTHAVEGSKVISEPDGWEKSTLGFERHPEFHSLVEYFKSSFQAYGSNGSEDGGRDWLLNVEKLHGVDAELDVLVEIDEDETGAFETLYTGQLAVSMFVESLDTDHMLQMVFTQNGFWTKFISRYKNKVNIKSTVTESGDAVTAASDITLPLPSQVIVKNYKAVQEFNLNIQPYDPDLAVPYLIEFFTLGFNNEEINEIGIGNERIRNVNFGATIPPFLFSQETGTIRFNDIKITCSVPYVTEGSAAGGYWGLKLLNNHKFYSSIGFIEVYIQKNNDPVIQFTSADRTVPGTVTRNDGTVITCSGNTVTDYTLSDVSFEAKKGDYFRIYIKVLSSGSYPNTFFPFIWGNKGWDHSEINGQSDFSKGAEGSKFAGNFFRCFSSYYWVGQGYQGYWDASTNAFPATALDQNAASRAIKTNDTWIISGVGIIGGVPVDSDYVLTALVDAPGTTPSNWWISTLSLYEGKENYGDTFIDISFDTIAPDTTTKAFLTHDVMDAITKRITDNESSLYSEYLGNAFTSRVYGVTGCGSLLANAKGLHIRGYDLTAKPFFKSAEEWWQGINPIHNLGLGYEKLAGVDIIRVERKEHFYDDGTPLVNLSNVYSIKRSYDSEHHFNQVEIGYDKWQSQAATGTGTASGIDDPQTKHTYNSRFRRIGKKITLFSKWVAASLTLETTRRVGVLKSSNYTYDDETFVIALRSLGAGSFTPELDENFTTLTNLTNRDTRYNSRLTPGRNFLRWANYLNGCLQSYIGSVFKFASGEGNFDMTSLMSTSCLGDGTFVDEKGNFAVTSDFLFIPMPYEINHFMTWDQYKLIRDNKNRCIGISQTEADFKKFFIKSLEYQIGTGLVKLIAWPKEPFDIVVPDFVDDSPTRYYEDFYESQYE